MATENAINSNKPIEVAKGGTGAASHTAFSPLAGGTTPTAALQSIGTGSSGQYLQSGGAGTLPTWGALPTFFEVLATDPATPTNAQVWYNSTSHTFKAAVGPGVWSSGTNIGTAARSLAGAGASSSDFLRFGGVTTVAVATTESYDGSSWTSENSLNTARSSLGGNGSTSDALSFGGFNDLTTTERYNGTSWTSKTGLNTGVDGPLGGAGADGEDCLCFGGNNSGSPQTATQLYSGTGDSWTNKTGLNGARQGLAGSGNASNALAYGGDNSGVLATTEYYDLTGDSWTNKASMNTARKSLAGAGYNDASSALSFGGDTGSDSAVTELYDLSGNSWTAQGNLSTARRNLTGGGTTSAAVSVAGFTGSNSAVVEEFTDLSIVTFTVT